MVQGLDPVAYQEAVATIKENGGSVIISDLGITINGTQIDTLKVDEAYEGAGDKVYFFAGKPFDDENDDFWEELVLTTEQTNDVLNAFNYLF